MSSGSFHHSHIQRRVIRVVLAIAALVLLIGTPLVLFDELRLNIALELGLVPGEDAEQLADGDDGAVLVVLPLGEYSGVGLERYRYKAEYIARPADPGMTLTDIDSGAEVDLPLESISYTAADADGAHVLFRGPDPATGDEVAVLVITDDNRVEPLPRGQMTPNLPGDWETETWEKVTGTCDRYSPHEKYVACFNRADAASYLAGDWQIDVQLYGDYEVSEPVYRGLGFFLPTLGFAHDDSWLYFQNEEGLYRIEVPESLQAHYADATPQGDEHNP